MSQTMSFSEFLAMGNHGFYVWSCYAVGLVIFAGLYFSVHLQHKMVLQQLQRRYRRQELKQQQAVTETPNTADNDTGDVV